MIQDIAPHFLNNTFIPGMRPEDDDLLVIFSDDRILFCVDKEAKKFDFPTVGELKARGLEDENLVYLFAVDEKNIFISLDANVEADDRFDYYPMGEIRRMDLQPRTMVFAAFTAYHLARWYADNRYCGRCGRPTVPDTTSCLPRMNGLRITIATTHSSLIIPSSK